METSLVVSILALCVSVLTAWFTLFQRGRIKMTQPTIVYFGPDGGPDVTGQIKNKVFLRSLLFSTGKRGTIVEEMFVRLYRAESKQTFNIWVLGDQHLTRGSGVFVGPEGLAKNHHFLLPDDGTAFDFLPGHYRLEVFVGVLGSKAPTLLKTIELEVSEEQSRELKSGKAGLFFDWGPDSHRFHAHIRTAVEPSLESLLRSAGGSGEKALGPSRSMDCD